MPALRIMNHSDLEFIYKVKNISEVQTSHDPICQFCVNPRYEFENERLYDREPASRDKVIDLASHLDPAFLLECPTCIDGAPVVDRRGNVLGGNGRAMAVKFAYEHLRLSYANNYKDAVVNYANSHDIEIPRGDIMLVRELVDNVTLKKGQELISLFNCSFTHSRDKKADARSRGLRLSQKTLSALAYHLYDAESLRKFFDTVESTKIVKMLLNDGLILESERNEYIDCEWYLNGDGKNLLEQALRSRVFPDYKSLDRLNNMELGKLDAAIPYIVQAENVDGWSINKALARAIDLSYEYKTDSIKDIDKFLNQGSMVTGYKYERYSALEVKIFRMLIKFKKADFVDTFKRYATQAHMSPENGGLGCGLSPKQAQIKVFDIENQIVSSIEECRVAKKHIKAARQSKNDCTKANSILIESFTNENDIEIAKSFVSGHFNTDIELVANSKTQYRITDAAGNEFPGYRLIRSGRQWQIRRLNEVMEAQGSDMTEKKIETMQENQVIEPENKVEISKNTPALLALPQAPMALPAIWKETENQVENIIVDPVQENIMKLYNGAMARIALKKHIKAELMPSGNEILMYKEDWIRKSGRKFKHVDYHKVVKDNIDLINYYSVTGYDILILLDDIEVIEYLIGISNISIDEIRKNSIKKLLRYIP